ncbi:MAG: RDD family protein [Cystobacterineae bacterium]|nr:RDD family protein [Cystobacterineae bacterium]
MQTLATPTLQDARTLCKYYCITTPEHIEFKFELAGIFRRSLALLVDWFFSFLLVFVVLFVVALLLGIPAVNEVVAPFAALLRILAVFFINVFYMWAFEWFWGGKTLGKHFMRIRVIQKTGVRLGGMQAFLRNITRPIDAMPFFLIPFLKSTISCYFVGASFAVFSSTQQRLGDFLANTLVIYERPVRLPPPIQFSAEEERFWNNSKFESNLHSLTAQERSLLLQSSLQREELSLEARLRVFRALSAHLQHEFNFKKPAHISDEKLVLSATHKLFSPTAEKKGA